MAELHQTAVSLRFLGDDLDPDALTRRLGATPTDAVRKGALWPTANGAARLARTGRWRLTVALRSPGDLEGQIAEILAGLTPDLGIWNDLSQRFRGNLFCGLFLAGGSEGASLSPGTLAAIGARGLRLDLAIYGRDLDP